MSEPAAFRILHLCTGNICRSPMAELLTRRGLLGRLGPAADAFEVSSAGTWGHTGAAMEDFALSTLADYGVDGADFRARELEPAHLLPADLVLTATREHRSAAVVMHPRGAGRTFTLLEFGRLIAPVRAEDLPGEDAPARAHALVAAARANRGLVPPPEAPGDDDLSDPYQAPESSFRLCAERIDSALQRPLDLIAGRP